MPVHTLLHSLKCVPFPAPVLADYVTCHATVSDFERPAVQDEGPAEQPSTSGTPRPSVYELIWHASDSSVKPIVANRRIERLPEPKWDAQALPFKPLVGPCQLLQTGCFCLWLFPFINQGWYHRRIGKEQNIHSYHPLQKPDNLAWQSPVEPLTCRNKACQLTIALNAT